LKSEENCLLDDLRNYILKPKDERERDKNLLLSKFEESTENTKLAEFIMDGVGDYPCSKEPLIITQVDFEGIGGGIALQVISSEALEDGATPHIACVVNREKTSPF
jgi:hypothetical protein